MNRIPKRNRISSLKADLFLIVLCILWFAFLLKYGSMA